MQYTKTIAATAVMLSVAGAAWATTNYILKTDKTTTQSSGTRPSAHVESPGGDYQGLYEMSMWEDGDSPCKLAAKSRHVNTYKGDTVTWKDSRCNAKSKKTVSFSNTDTYIDGVQVCVNGGGDRVKGVKIFGKKLNRSTGALTDAGSKKFERTNCKTWKTTRYCPAGKVASGVSIGYQLQQFIPNNITGLALECRSVIKK